MADLTTRQREIVDSIKAEYVAAEDVFDRILAMNRHNAENDGIVLSLIAMHELDNEES